jgi:ribokinase
MADTQRPMILVLGNICRDTTFYVDQLPLPGETINASATDTGLGGKGLNQAIAASNAGARVRLVAGVGEDWIEADSSCVEAAGGMGLELALVRKAGTVDCSTIVVSASGENVIVTQAAQAEALSVDDVTPFLALGRNDILLLQCNLQRQVSVFAAQLAKRAGARVIFNPAPLKPWASSLQSITDVLILNRQEAQAWTGKSTASEAVSALEVPYAIITLGVEGCLLRRRGEAPNHFPAPATEAVDTTGAGDTFAGVFAAEWLATGDDNRSIRLALRAASASVTKRGAAGSIPSPEEVDRLRRQFS